jgi:hypothetical protein
MKKIFTVELSDDDLDDDLLPYTNAINRDSMLHFLKYNFWRQWKHADAEPTGEEVLEALHKLFEEYKVIIAD